MSPMHTLTAAGRDTALWAKHERSSIDEQGRRCWQYKFPFLGSRTAVDLALLIAEPSWTVNIDATRTPHVRIRIRLNR